MQLVMEQVMSTENGPQLQLQWQSVSAGLESISQEMQLRIHRGPYSALARPRGTILTVYMYNAKRFLSECVIFSQGKFL